MAVELDYAQPLFFEQQRVARMLGRVGIWLLVSATGYLAFGVLIYLVFRGTPVVLIAGLNLFFATLLFCYIAGQRVLEAVTILEPTALQLQLRAFGVIIWTRTIALSEVVFVELVERGDAPIALAATKKDLNFVSRRLSIDLALTESRHATIGSGNPYKLLEAVRNAMRTQVTPLSQSPYPASAPAPWPPSA
jgi:hypothetical protein